MISSFYMCSLMGSSGSNGRLCHILDDFLTFVKSNNDILFYSGQDTDKKAREALLLLETQRREQSVDTCKQNVTF